jgi:hypothetical protein
MNEKITTYQHQGMTVITLIDHNNEIEELEFQLIELQSRYDSLLVHLDKTIAEKDRQIQVLIKRIEQFEYKP